MELCEEALDVARAVDSPETLYSVIESMLFATWSRRCSPRRRVLADELVTLGGRLDDPVARIPASALHLTCLLEAGDVNSAGAEVGWLEGEIGRFELPSSFRWYGPLYRGMRAVMKGRLEEGERLAIQSYGHAQHAQLYDAARAFALQIFQIRCDQGRQGELFGKGNLLVHRELYLPLEAYILSETGRLDAARPIFECFVDGYDPRHDENRSVTGMVLASVCEALDDSERAAFLYRGLADEGDLVAVNVLAWVCQGSLHWPLAKLAVTRGEFEQAELHFEEAERRNAEIGARPYLVRTRLDLARLRAEAGMLGEACELSDVALVAAREIGMLREARRAEQLLARLGA